MDIKKIVVTLNQLVIDKTESDQGDALEVFGRVVVGRMAIDPDIGEGKNAVETLASLVPLDSVNLFDKSSDDPQQIVRGTAFVIETSAELTFASGEFLQIAGHLQKRDDVGGVVADPIVDFDMRTPFDLIGSDILNLGPFEHSGEKITVKLSALQISRIDA